MKAFLTQNWQRKTVAIITAIILWLFVNHSIIATKTIPNVPIRIIKLPTEKTVIGLLPNGILKKRVSLTVSGTRDVIEELEPGDLEVVIDASTIDRDEWIVRIGKKNLISLNPSIDLKHHVTSVSHNEFVIKLSRIVTARIPLTILPPVGEPPKGYELLDVWPKELVQTLSGPAEEIQKLKTKGLKMTFDLSKITKNDLDSIRNVKKGPHTDEVSFPIPEKWKKVLIRYRNNSYEELNDPEAENLKIDFLYRDLLGIDRKIPIRVFYPLEFSNQLNPGTYKLTTGSKVEEYNNIKVFTFPLYVKDVSRLFLEVIRDNLEIVLVAAPKSQREVLEWSPEVIDPGELEDTYVAYMIANESKQSNGYIPLSKHWEDMIRDRFRKYLERVIFWVTPNQKLSLETVLEDDEIKVK
ncbi:MAG: hypothetical protein VX777_02205 [Chlamydiota bacterium]|nr:hypothetical protein [Chlamydiota bacterium]